MAKEVTIKELLKKAGVDGARYQELASYLAAHAVYALDLTDNDSESSANQTHIICKSNATKRNQTQPKEELTMIKTRIYLTSGSHVDVQESFDDVGYAMSHSAPGWTFTLKLENGELVSLVRDHVAYFTTHEQDKQQKQKAEQALTYREFVKAFNAVDQRHHASPSSCGGVVVVDLDGHLEASLDPNDCGWSLYTSARGYLRYDELALMADLANTPPELRGRN